MTGRKEIINKKKSENSDEMYGRVEFLLLLLLYYLCDYVTVCRVESSATIVQSDRSFF